MIPKYFVRAVISGSERAIMMMQLFGLTIVVIFGVVTSQNHDVNLQTPYSGMTRRRSVEATTAFPPDLTIQDEGMRMFLTRLETLSLEKLDNLITDTNRRFQSLENQLSQCSLCHAATPIVQNNEILEVKIENLSKTIQEFIDATRNMPSDVETIKQNVSSLISVARSLVNLSSNSELKPIFNEGLQEIKDLQTPTAPSCSSNLTVQYARNCREVQECGKTASGVYMIQPEHAPKHFEAVCDLETMGGGWTVIQKRFDGSQDFYLDWQNYKNGFGNLDGEFWLGLENIHLLTGSNVNELLIELGDFESRNRSALYSEFRIGSEAEGYPLQILGAYSDLSDAGDSLRYHVGMKFSTKDNDQDYHTLSCAQLQSGAWWYKQCANSNLNGKYFEHGQVPENSIIAVIWFTFKNSEESLKQTRMLVRPKGYGNNN